MAFSDLKLIGFLKAKMRWHQARQQLLAQNVANADTPGYRPQDLAPITFEGALASEAPRGVQMARTNMQHIAGALTSGTGAYRASSGMGWERTPAGNAVVLQEEMMKVAANQFDHQLASNLYSKSLCLLKTALGRGS